MKKWVVLAIAASFVLNPISVVVTEGAESTTIRIGRSLRRYRVTKEQIAALKQQPGIQFIEAMPAAVEKGIIAVSIPESLGGGYLLGTPAALASAFNAAGVTVGLTAAAVSGAAAVAGGVAAATLGAIVAAAVSGRGAVTHRHLK